MNAHTLISWNLNSVLAKLPFIHKLLQDYDPIVLCLQETKLTPDKSFFLKNFNVYRNDHSADGHAKGGTLITVSTSVYSQQLSINTELQVIAVRVYLDTPITICSIYLHQSDDITPQKMLHLIQQFPQPYILTGDFNAHNTLWGSAQTDQRGQTIEDFFNLADIALLNDGSPTRFNVYNGSSSAIDLSLSCTNLFSRLQWSVCPSLYTSDHHPQVIKLLSTNVSPQYLPKKWHFKDADWEMYRAILDFSKVYLNQSLDSALNRIVEEILAAANRAIPHTQTTLINGHFRHRVPWWNENCRQLVQAKHKLFNKCKRHPTVENLTLFKIARAKARREIFKSKKESWRQFISTINSGTPSTILWNKLRSINNKRVYAPIPAVYDQNKQLQTSPVDIVETFAEHYSKVTQADPAHPIIWNIPSTNSDELVPDEINVPLTVKDVKTAICSMKNTSPGPDGIYALMLKHLNFEQCKALTFFYNRIWKEHDLPIAWGEAYILPIRKPGKEAADPASYRPISLTNILCKVLEKILVKRLHQFFSRESNLDSYQCGFRPGRSTLDNLLYLQEEIHLGFKHKQHISCIFFDVEKAFDRLLPTTIIEAMQNLGLTGNILYFVHNFLKQRYFLVRIGQILSASRQQETGTPQGSVLSPVLFILALNSVSDVFPRTIQHLLYADNLVIFLRHNNPVKATCDLQNTINHLSEWGAEKGLKFSSSKTKVLNFTRKRMQISLMLTLYNEPLVQVAETTFLGMQFDYKLSWTSHIKQLKKKCFQRLNILKVLNGSAWGSDRKCLLRLYTCYIRSLIDYGSIIYSTASNTTLNMLSTIQNAALCISTGALRSSPIKSLQVETHVLPLYHHRNVAVLLYYSRVHTLPLNINAYRLTSSAVSFSNFRSHCQQLLQKYGLQELDGVQHITKNDILPAVIALWQQEWIQGPLTNLRLLKLNLEEWTTSYQADRKSEKVLARVRIGHILLTHTHYYNRLPPPVCDTCNTRINVSHILDYCPKYDLARLLYYGASPYPVLESLNNDGVNIKKFFVFLENCKLKSQL